MSRSDHRGPGKFWENHSNTGQEPSKTDRSEWKKEQRDYWNKESDNDRWKK